MARRYEARYVTNIDKYLLDKVFRGQKPQIYDASRQESLEAILDLNNLPLSLTRMRGFRFEPKQPDETQVKDWYYDLREKPKESLFESLRYSKSDALATYTLGTSGKRISLKVSDYRYSTQEDFGRFFENYDGLLRNVLRKKNRGECTLRVRHDLEKDIITLTLQESYKTLADREYDMVVIAAQGMSGNQTREKLHDFLGDLGFRIDKSRTKSKEFKRAIRFAIGSDHFQIEYNVVSHPVPLGFFTYSATVFEIRTIPSKSSQKPAKRLAHRIAEEIFRLPKENLLEPRYRDLAKLKKNR